MADDKRTDKKAPKGDKPAAPAAKPQAKAAKADKGERAAKPAEIAHAADQPHQPARLKDVYRNEIVPALTKQFGYKTRMQVPRVTKITLNMGVSEAVSDKKVMDHAVSDLTKIAGQKPVVTKAKKSIAGFKLREGQSIGCKVTLRRARMYEFIDRLINIALPRVRDFRGLNPKSFDGRGNYSMGVKEHIIFPEIDYDKAAEVWGMDITVCTTARNDDEARALLAAFNFPFRQ